MKPRIVMTKSAFNNKNLFTSKLDLHLRNKPLEFHLCNPALCGPDTWILLKADQKYLETFTMRCCRRINISGTSRVRKEVLHRVRYESDIIHTINRRYTNRITGCAPKGVSCRAAAPPPYQNQNLKNKQLLQPCNDVKRFKRFTLHPNSAVEIG
jgi:hypothetical protein